MEPAMPGTFEQDLQAEIEAFRAEVREREERRSREEHERTLALSGQGDLTHLGLEEIRSLVSLRYENARLAKRLEAAERRVAELEHPDGRAG
jgi:hypothetical protein